MKKDDKKILAAFIEKKIVKQRRKIFEADHDHKKRDELAGRLTRLGKDLPRTPMTLTHGKERSTRRKKDL